MQHFVIHEKKMKIWYNAETWKDNSQTLWNW